MTNLIPDFRLALRTLWKAPLFTTLTVVSLALGIGANTTIFTLLDQVVLRKLPVERPDELVQVRIDGELQRQLVGRRHRDLVPDVPGVPRSQRRVQRDVRAIRVSHARRHGPRHRACERRAGVGHLLSDAGRGGGRGPAVHARRRPRARCALRGGALARLLEDALLGRPCRGRTEADGQQPPLHGDWRGGGRVQRHRRRHCHAGLRADDDEGADDAGLELPGRPAGAIRARVRAAEDRTHRRVGRPRPAAVVQGPARRGTEGPGVHQHHGLRQT